MFCVICNNDLSNSEQLLIKEMMFGTRECFEYLICNDCQCIQIKSIPDDMSKYYPDDYYTSNKKFTEISDFKRVFWNIRRKLALSTLFPIINFLSYNSILTWARITRLNVNSRILDVGCGNGDLLFEFSKHGFKNLYGIDPYPHGKIIDLIQFQEIDLLNFDTKCKFDLIIFNHSFEHIRDQKETIAIAKQLLSPIGNIILRIPVKNQALDLYRENWIQLDAPRHLFVHSITSIRYLCSKVGLNVYHTIFDSTWFQYIGSEQYKKDIGVFEPNSYKFFPHKSIFTPRDFKFYSKKAKIANKKGLGDQVTLFLKK
jgi:SAM-dependent methyltransferase